MKSALFLVLTLAANVALAQTPRTTYASVGTLTNCSAATLDDPINACEVRNISRGIYGVEGYNLLTLEIKLDADSAGGGVSGITGISFQLEACSEGLSGADCTDDADWALVQGESYSSGTLTLADGTMSKTVSANTDFFAYWSVGINYRRVRVANITALTANAADDIVTVKAWLGVSPAF